MKLSRCRQCIRDAGLFVYLEAENSRARRNSHNFGHNFSSHLKSWMTSGHLRRIQELYKLLTDKLVAKTVAIELYQRDALSFRRLEKILGCKNQCKAAKELLKVLLQKSKNNTCVYECFLEALRNTGQHHIFLWISQPDYKIDTPHMDFMQQHYKFMMDNLDIEDSGLITELYTKQVLNRNEKKELQSSESSESSTRRIQILLSMLSRKSSSDFEAFLEALNETGQGHIANKIRGIRENVTMRSAVGLFRHKKRKGFVSHRTE